MRQCISHFAFEGKLFFVNIAFKKLVYLFQLFILNAALII